MIVEKMRLIKNRGKVPKYTEFESDKVGHGKKLYEYFICDYCGDKIILSEPKHQRTGGTVKLSYVLTKSETVEVALCNKCVVLALKEFEKR